MRKTAWAFTTSLRTRSRTGVSPPPFGSMAPIRDLGSLDELREAVRGRGRGGSPRSEARYDQLQLDSPPTREQIVKKVSLEQSIGILYMYEGKFPGGRLLAGEGARNQPGRRSAGRGPQPADGRAGNHRHAPGRDRELPGVRRPVELHFPDRPRGRPPQSGGLARGDPVVHRLSSRPSPRDLRVIWLLNIAYMTLGEYPEKVPPQYLLPAKLFRSAGDVGRFTNVASQVGLGARGPNLAGGSVFDDFNGDGLPDLFTTSLDADLGASLFINRGDGTFDDRSAWAGLGDQVYALNVTRADFDNDGDLDVLLLRGAWENPLRLSLLRNKGNGAFDDVTVASGLAEPIASESAAWGDYDDDGLVDVFVCGEYLPPGAVIVVRAGRPPQSLPALPQPRRRQVRERRRRGRRHQRAMRQGVGLGRLRWRRPARPVRLEHGPGSAASTITRGRASSATSPPELGVTGTDSSFACWFWDYDNDGLLDLYVNDYRAKVAEVLCSALGLEDRGIEPPPVLPQPRLGRLQRCLQGGRARPGHGTHGRELRGRRQRRLPRHLPGDRRHVLRGPGSQPHVQECRGRTTSRTSPPAPAPAIFKRGTVSRSPTGIATATSTCSSSSAARRPGTSRTTRLFQNPGQGRHWLKIKLVGTKTNRAALGAKIRVDLKCQGRPATVDPPHGRQQLQLWRQQPRRDDRAGRDDARRRADDLLADEPNDPDLPRRRRRPGDRDHRGHRILQGPPSAEAPCPVAMRR